MTTAALRPPFATLGVLLLLSAVPAAALAEDNLDRLFFTPERRQAMDRQRQLNPLGTAEPANQETPTLTINGVVTRSSGKRTVWINGEIKNDATLTVKVGDTLDKNTGETTPLLDEGKVVVHPAGKRAKAR